VAVDKNGNQIKGSKIVREGFVSQGFEYASFPSDFQKQEMEQCFGCARKVYNEYISGLYEYLESIHYQSGKILYQIPSYTTITNKYDFMKTRLHDSKVYANVKKNFEHSIKKYNEDFAWKESPQYKKSSIRRAKNTDFKLSFRDLKGLPKFHSKKKGKFSYITNNYKDPKGKDVIFLEDSVNEKTKKEEYFLRQPKVGLLKIHMHRPLPNGYIINNVTIKREYYRYMVSINVDFPFQSFERKTINESKIITLDYSQSGFYVDHHGNKANPPKFYKKNEKKLKRLQRRYSRKDEDDQKNPSQNKQKALKEVQKLTNKVTLQRKHWLHTLSYQIANEWECVGLEDLDLRNLAQTLYLGKNLHDNGFGLFRTYLQYKLKRQGKLLIKTNKFFPSSKRCSNCHHVKSDLKLSERVYKCLSCGNEMDRDQNAAENIKQEVSRLLIEQGIGIIAA
jgi:putative transposase